MQLSCRCVKKNGARSGSETRRLRPVSPEHHADDQVYNKSGRHREEKRPDESGPKSRPDQSGKDMPVEIIPKGKMTQMNAMMRAAMQDPAPDPVFGVVNRRHRPDQDVV